MTRPASPVSRSVFPMITLSDELCSRKPPSESSIGLNGTPTISLPLTVCPFENSM